MSRTRIYQAPFDQTAFGFHANADYVLVWEELTENRSLDEIWERFQRVDEEAGPWPPYGYEGRSLSIGDIIALDMFLYTVEPVGFCEVGAAFRDAFWEGHAGDEFPGVTA